MLRLLWYFSFAPLVVLYVALAFTSPLANHFGVMSTAIWRMGQTYSLWHRNAGRLLAARN